MNIRITKCSDSRYWYANLIGAVYQVRTIDNDRYWCRPDIDVYSGWNFILFTDCEVIEIE